MRSEDVAGPKDAGREEAVGDKLRGGDGEAGVSARAPGEHSHKGQRTGAAVWSAIGAHTCKLARGRRRYGPSATRWRVALEQKTTTPDETTSVRARTGA